eukprot:gnl/TRDRNA2_/TRDRNA2_159896_c0_seq1.p1 gnl/TRDRNA2_/TRDRNA2_159896_c0~~gnl/TRDRNA2_/TRDRNA2_159896_c0_seq1.p1  ORF type:complete len:212 (-),score=22.13 gnl/TRDRNA2_/TRDRNA2_159896_c0_seq1:473-1108(-)
MMGRHVASLLFLASLLLQWCAESRPCYTQVRTNGSTCESAGLIPLSSKDECQNAIDFVNAVDDILMRPGGPVTECSYTFYPLGCYTSCKGPEQQGVPTHYFCARFNSKVRSNLAVDLDKKVFLYCGTSSCCTCTNGFADMDQCPREACRACYRGYILAFDACWPAWLVQSSMALIPIGCFAFIIYKVFVSHHKARQQDQGESELVWRTKES